MILLLCFSSSHLLTDPSISLIDLLGRLIRLIPPTNVHIRTLFNHRLPSDHSLAFSDWTSLISNTSALWTPIPLPQREFIRATLLHLNLEILKRARPSSAFNFTSASIGNLFLTGARLFTGNFESAIYLLGVVGGVPEGVRVIPVVNSMFSHHISASLADGTIITGQNAISHPSAPTATPTALDPPSSLKPIQLADTEEEDANIPGTLPTLRTPNILFSKSTSDDLPSRIQRIWYINPYGQEMQPSPNPKVLDAIKNADVAIYSIGSLYTSIIPCLILKGVGAAIATTPSLKYKILILNGSLDRETGPRSSPFAATDFVEAIARGAEESQGRLGPASREVWRNYVTHVVHLEGQGAPVVDRQQLAKEGIECVRVYGRKGVEEGEMRYDGRGLGQALEMVLGRREGKGEKSRRNTLEG
ncbi:hypothetical protein MMC14_008123 [Varicellaria rhodocarpa]|nr:hypothetical protein [Varicellaria rhodocarpa]